MILKMPTQVSINSSTTRWKTLPIRTLISPFGTIAKATTSTILIQNVPGEETAIPIAGTLKSNRPVYDHFAKSHHENRRLPGSESFPQNAVSSEPFPT
jgi:hypothetical protein